MDWSILGGGFGFAGGTSILEGLLESVVWWTVVLAQIEVHESLLSLNPEGVSKLGDQASVLVKQVEGTWLLVIIMVNEGQSGLAELEWNLRSSVEQGVQGLSVQTSLKVVSDNVELIETIPKTFCSWDVVDLTETENVLVFSMSQSGAINVEETVGLGRSEARFSEELSWGGWWDDVEVVVLSSFSFSGLNVFKGGSVVDFINFDQFRAVFDLNTVLLEVLLDELISDIEVLAEVVVGVDNGELGDWGQFTIGFVPSPDFSGIEEVERTDFSSVWVRGNGVDGISVCEVVNPSLMFIVVGSPGWIFLWDENWVVKISPGFFETWNALDIFLKTGSNNQVVIFYSSSVSQNDCVFFWDDSLSTNTVRVGSMGIDGKLSVENVFSLGSLSLLENRSQWELFVGVSVKDNHDLIVILCDFLELSGEDTTDVTTEDNNVIFLEILGSWLAFLEQASESTSGLISQAFEKLL